MNELIRFLANECEVADERHRIAARALNEALELEQQVRSLQERLDVVTKIKEGLQQDNVEAPAP